MRHLKSISLRQASCAQEDGFDVQNSIKDAGVRTRAIERQLRKVEELSADEARQLLGDDAIESGSSDTGVSPDAD